VEWAKAAAGASAADIEGSNHEHIQKNLGRACRVVYRSDGGEYAGLCTAGTKAQHPLNYDDIGWMQVQAYADGMGVGETPNIDRLAKEGARFVDYVAMQSCTSARNAFFTGMYPLRTGMIPPQLPGSPTYLKPGTPALAKFLLDLG